MAIQFEAKPDLYNQINYAFSRMKGFAVVEPEINLPDSDPHRVQFTIDGIRFVATFDGSIYEAPGGNGFIDNELTMALKKLLPIGHFENPVEHSKAIEQVQAILMTRRLK